MTSTSASSVSGLKSSPQSHHEDRSKSGDTNCSSNSSCFFKRRKPMNPLAYSKRPPIHKANNPVKQRVMSAKLLKLRQLQSQLNDASFHLAEVARENQTLKTLQKRQDKALSKYENTNADLPRLIHSHEEEIRVLREKNKQMKKTMKDLMDQLKQKEDELNKSREQLAHLEKLNKDKHLTEREKLTDLMEEYKIKLQKTEEQVSTLNRKLLLESKTSKQRLNSEMVKHKQCQKELLHAFDEIDRLSGLLDAKENLVRPRNPRFNKLPMKEPISLTSMKHYQPINRNSSNEKLTSHAPVTEIKLEPITNGNSTKEIDSMHRKNQNEFKAPMENIKQRLSAGSGKIHNGAFAQTSDASSESRDNSAGSFKGRPRSSMKLEKLPSVQERTKMKSDNNNNRDESNDDRLFPSNDIGDNSSGNEDDYVDNKGIVVRYDRSKELGNDCNSVRNKLTNDEPQNFHELEQSVHSENTSNDHFVDTPHPIDKSAAEEETLVHQQRRDSDGSTSDSVESEKDIERMAENLDAAIQKAADNSKEDFDKNLSNYCSDVLSSVKSCSKVIELHKDSLKESKKDTCTLLETLQSTEKVEAKLKHSFFNMDDDMAFVTEILNEEHKFQVENKGRKSSEREKNGRMEKKSMVNLENKKKLLATLRAIDNGDNIDEKQDTVVKEMFGHINVRH